MIYAILLDSSVSLVQENMFLLLFLNSCSIMFILV